MCREHPYWFWQLPSTLLCGFINNWFKHFSTDGHLGLFPNFWYFKYMSLYISSMLLVLEMKLLYYCTNVTFARHGQILFHRHSFALLWATCESLVSPNLTNRVHCQTFPFFLSCIWILSSQVLPSLEKQTRHSPALILSTWSDCGTCTGAAVWRCWWAESMVGGGVIYVLDQTMESPERREE